MNRSERERFRMLIADAIGVAPASVTLFARGRVALYAILRALDVGPGDEVILPAFTCVAVPNAVLYARARPVWVDIDPRTFCLDPASVEASIGPRTKVILAQNTFGLSADLDAIMAVAGHFNVTVVDDCTHGLGGRYHGKANGATAPYSFFSTQWSKPISTGLGGFAIDRDGALTTELHHLEAAAAEPSAVRVAALRTLVYGRERAGSGLLFQGGRAAYRVFSRTGIVPGSSSQAELDGTTMPRGFLATLSESQARLGCDRLRRLPIETEGRRRIARRYSDWLVAHGRTTAAESDDVEHSFLRYPLRVADRRRFVDAAARAGIDLGDWFVSPVHPVTHRLERWGYVEGVAPNAERACRELVNLPTDPSLRDRDVQRVHAFLGQWLEYVL